MGGTMPAGASRMAVRALRSLHTSAVGTRQFGDFGDFGGAADDSATPDGLDCKVDGKSASCTCSDQGTMKVSAEGDEEPSSDGAFAAKLTVEMSKCEGVSGVVKMALEGKLPTAAGLGGISAAVPNETTPGTSDAAEDAIEMMGSFEFRMALAAKLTSTEGTAELAFGFEMNGAGKLSARYLVRGEGGETGAGGELALVVRDASGEFTCSAPSEAAAETDGADKDPSVPSIPGFPFARPVVRPAAEGTTDLTCTKSGATKSAARALAVASSETRNTVRAVVEGRIQVTGDATLALLYALDRPAHRANVVAFIEGQGGRVTFEDEGLGYLDATLPWSALATLLASTAALGLDASIAKLELDNLRSATAASPSTSEVESASDPVTEQPGERGPTESSGLFGPVHSAGYGAKVDEFRVQAARDLGVSPEDLEGQGTVVAVYDSGIDLSRNDIFQDRVKDVLVADDAVWTTPTQTLAEVARGGAVPAGLEDIAEPSSMRFFRLPSTAGDPQAPPLAVLFVEDGEAKLRIRPPPRFPLGSRFGTSASPEPRVNRRR
jgi:hypothetical protein